MEATNATLRWIEYLAPSSLHADSCNVACHVFATVYYLQDTISTCNPIQHLQHGQLTRRPRNYDDTYEKCFHAPISILIFDDVR